MVQTTLAELNACARGRFVEALGWIFEDSPWVAERAWIHRPFADLDQLHAAMVAVVKAAGRDAQLALLRAHPDLGTRIRMSDASAGEQAGAGLDRLTSDEFSRLLRLTSAYRAKFGFPFLLAVRGCTKLDVLDALEDRLPRSVASEWEEALLQTARIAELRLREVIPGRQSEA
jgi:2-oxo-4-hydroxy-4-carboxy-5-ureidoimidazoline decarboxylase